MKKFFLFLLSVPFLSMNAQYYWNPSYIPPYTQKNDILTFRRDSLVITYQVSGDYNPNDLLQLELDRKTQYPLATMVGGATGAYNCHGYAFIVPYYGGLGRWLGSDVYPIDKEVDKFFSSETFVPVSKDLCKTNVHGRVFWNRPNGNHTAVATDDTAFVISKWGPGPIMKHGLRYSPYRFDNGFSYFRKYDFYPPNPPNPPTTITGPDLVPCSGTVTYSIPTTGMLSYSWSAPGLNILGSQATNILTVEKNPNSTTQGFYVLFTGTFLNGTTVSLTKAVDIGVPRVKSLTANTYNISAGNYITFSVNPSISSPGKYEWFVTPSSGVYQYVWNVNNNDITFNYPGSYTVGVRTKVDSPPCVISPGTYTTVYVNVY